MRRVDVVARDVRRERTRPLALISNESLSAQRYNLYSLGILVQLTPPESIPIRGVFFVYAGETLEEEKQQTYAP